MDCSVCHVLGSKEVTCIKEDALVCINRCPPRGGMARGNNAALGSAAAHINHNYLHYTASRQPYQSSRFSLLGH